MTPTDRETISELVKRLHFWAQDHTHIEANLMRDAGNTLTRLIDENRALEKDVAAYKESNSVWAKTVADLQSQLAAAKEDNERAIKLLDDVLAEVDCYHDDWAERRNSLKQGASGDGSEGDAGS